MGETGDGGDRGRTSVSPDDHGDRGRTPVSQNGISLKRNSEKNYSE